MNNDTESQVLVSQDGNANLFGLDISIKEILGEKIVDQYLANITPEDIKIINTELNNHLYEFKGYGDDKEKVVKKYISSKDSWGYSNTTETPIWRAIRKHFEDMYANMILEKCKDILDSDLWKDKVESIANEIVEYAANGWKEDMKENIRRQLVGNILDSSNYYIGNYDLIQVINEQISRRINDNF